MILVRRQQSRTGLYLAAAALFTAAWALSVAVWWQTPLACAASLELVRSAAWYGFILHLYRRGLGGRQALTPVFVTMGLVALLLVGGLPLLDAVPAHQPAIGLRRPAIAIRLGFAVGNILLL